MAKLHPVVNFKKWIDENRHLLKPPVGNKMVYEDGDYIVMVVGGPNSRKDFHINQTPEFFYQVEGNINLRIIHDGVPQDVPINEGDIYLLPPNVPHSPQRGVNTVGLVIESKRPEGMLDFCAWFCENCGNPLHKEPFNLKNIVTDLPKIFDGFYTNDKLTTCSKCGTKMERPK